MQEKEDEIIVMNWNPSIHNFLITRLLQQMRKLAQHASDLYTNAQILQKALTIIKATRDYKYSLII